MPTTREVEAARVERMRRQAAARAAEEEARPKPRNARERRRAELEAEHRAQRGPRWTCRIDECPQAHRWQGAASREEAEAEAHRHYMARHYVPPPSPPAPPRPARRVAQTAPRPLGSRPTAAAPPPPPPPARSAWDERDEPTWIDRM